MKTLLEKLNPSMLEVLAEQEVLYPNTVSKLKETLQSTYFAGDLRYGDALWLLSEAKVKDLKFLTLWEMFSSD